jgi:hypothetical protein
MKKLLKQTVVLRCAEEIIFNSQTRLIEVEGIVDLL